MTFLQQFHEKTLQIALDWQQSAASDNDYARFAVRLTNRSKRLDMGYWFQGAESYLFFSPYAVGDQHNKTKTIGLVATFDGDKVKKIYYELAFGAPDNQEDFEFYKKVGELLGEEVIQGKFNYQIGDLGTDWEVQLPQFLQEKVQAWAVMINHYHLIAFNAAAPETLRKAIAKVHGVSARALNRADGSPGRRVWFQSWESKLDYHESYFARLHYVHENPVHHGVVATSSEYDWCSASWLEQNADPAYRKMLYTFKIDRLNVFDDFD